MAFAGILSWIKLSHSHWLYHPFYLFTVVSLVCQCITHFPLFSQTLIIPFGTLSLVFNFKDSVLVFFSDHPSVFCFRGCVWAIFCCHGSFKTLYVETDFWFHLGWRYSSKYKHEMNFPSRPFISWIEGQKGVEQKWFVEAGVLLCCLPPLAQLWWKSHKMAWLGAWLGF